MTQPNKVSIIYLGPLHLEEKKQFSSNDDKDEFNHHWNNGSPVLNRVGGGG